MVALPAADAPLESGVVDTDDDGERLVVGVADGAPPAEPAGDTEGVSLADASALSDALGDRLGDAVLYDEPVAEDASDTLAVRDGDAVALAAPV